MSVGKEVIYESPDVPDPEEVELPKEAENGDIERVHLDLANAVKRFAGKFITAEGVGEFLIRRGLLRLFKAVDSLKYYMSWILL